MVLKLAYLNYWKDPSNDNYFTEFIKTNIGEVKIVKPNETPDVLVTSVCGNINNVRDVKAKCKIFYYGENLNRFPPYNNDVLLRDTYDLIVGFKKTDFSKKQIRFPLWLMYYKYYKWDEDNNILKFIQSKYSENIKIDKKIFASLVARHDRGGQRTIIANEVQKYGKIMYPSAFRKNTSIGSTALDKINYISGGTYNICPENSAYEGYFTEKIFQAFQAGTIPIYWAIGHPEPNIINKNKYCFCNLGSKENISKNIRDVLENSKKYIEGDLFAPDASKEIQLFYLTLKKSIESYVI